MPLLTDASVRKYKPGKVRREISDTKSSLRLTIQPSGHKSWIMRFRRPNGELAKLTLGVFDYSDDLDDPDDPKAAPELAGPTQPLSLWAARQLAAQIERQRAKGIDVVAALKAARSRQQTSAEERAANTFGACLKEFFIDYKTKRGFRARRWKDDSAVLGLKYPVGCNDPSGATPTVTPGGLADVWADKPMAEIDSHDVFVTIEEARNKKRGGSDGRARKMFSALSVFFRWLQQQRRVTSNPCGGVFRPGPPPSRERTLSDEEIRLFWSACDSAGAYGPMFKLMLLTGVRLREAAGMTRSELSADGVWTIGSLRTKNHNPLSLPLPPLALEIVNNQPPIGEAGYTFTNTGKRLTGFSTAKQLLDAAMAKAAGGPVPPWRTHDLRRTTATKLAELVVQLPVVEKILNHTGGSFSGFAGIYQRHTFAEEKRDALLRLSRHIEGLIAPKENVVDMAAKRKRSKR